ncbi:serine/threonine-protein kinase [Spiroplasma endosymbiont of Amphibalanus improvisus]|uniref:serine/threonine-protein kinase n=1 Tax=Spiroplasma endosymbiont of Amphibalanus improvisus TaxID=3066327 RepID=UPI00313BC20D
MNKEEQNKTTNDKKIKEIQNGELLEKRYRIIRKIAEGGMAEVYEAFDEYLNRKVAIKIMTVTLSKDVKAEEKAYKEYEAIAHLTNSQNVVKVFARFEYEKRQCIVLELMQGYTLKDWIYKIGSCTNKELKFYFSQINKAVMAIHNENIVHRDIKPENILISYCGEVRVTDFGVSVHGSGDKQDKKIIGTSKYMAPELVQSHPATNLSDIYALGVVLYELATGVPPFVDVKPILVAVKHVKEKAVLPRRIKPELSEDLEYIIMKSISKNPEERYLSVQEFNKDLEKVWEKKPILKKPLKNQILLYSSKTKKYSLKPMVDKYLFNPKFLKNSLLITFLSLAIVLFLVVAIIIIWL